MSRLLLPRYPARFDDLRSACKSRSTRLSRSSRKYFSRCTTKASRSSRSRPTASVVTAKIAVAIEGRKARQTRVSKTHACGSDSPAPVRILARRPFRCVYHMATRRKIAEHLERIVISQTEVYATYFRERSGANVMGRFAGKVAVITAASGIGRAPAIRFADQGATAVIADLNREGGEAAVRLQGERR